MAQHSTAEQSTHSLRNFWLGWQSCISLNSNRWLGTINSIITTFITTVIITTTLIAKSFIPTHAHATMRSTSFALALVALILSFIAVASANQVAPSPLPLEKRQAAAGGGAGVATTYTGVQTISGYNPPPSVALPSPTVPRGTILTTIPGYGNSSNSGNALNQGSGMSSGALSLLRDTHLISGAAASAIFMCVAVVAAAAVLL